ncbi:unnamed protein product [marine sediment metagenome]|uniref:DUF3352 domain-containing protein n=1 Tax=marine sediment metagenome TaxID=412755 RepID=X1AQI7_9ZZZZ
MSNKFKVSSLIVTVFLLFVFLFNFVYGNPLLEVIPEKVIGVLEIKDVELIKSLSELDIASFAPEGEEGSEIQDYRMTREEIKEELGFDVLDPLFLENIFSGGAILSCLGVSIEGAPEVLLVLSPSDSRAFIKFVGAIETKKDLKEEVSNYKGIDIVNVILPEDEDLDPLKSISYAFLGDTLVIGGNLSPVKKAIEVFQGESNSLIENSEYKEQKVKTEKRVEPSSFFFCLFGRELFQVLDELIEVVEEEELAKTLKDSRDSLEDIGTISMVGGYQEKQFKAYMIAQIAEKYIDVLKETDISNLQSLSMFPKNTFFYLASVLPLVWEEIKEDYISEDLRLNLKKSVQQVQEKSGVDIEKTIYSWPAKEFSLGLFDISAIFPKVGLIAGYSSEEKLIQNLYPVLENFAPMMGGTLVDNQYEGINYKSLPNPMFPLGYGIVGDRFVLSSGIANIIDAQKGDMATLDKLEAIKYMLSFPKVFSLLYIDMNSVSEIVGRFMQMAVQEIPEGAEETEGAKRKESLDAVLEGLSSLKNVLFWAGIEEDYSYSWLEINYK